MSWASKHIERLQAGESIEFRPRGNSMTGHVNDGDLVRVVPMDRDPQVGDIVLCRVNGRQHLHFVAAIRGNQYRIENARKHVNGWCSRAQIFGRVTEVKP
jgi:SOS-response transcriptional repressor LexA